MKCEYCSWSQTPELLPSVKTHVETSHPGLYPSVVWRKGEFVVAKKAKKSEAVYDAQIVHHEPAPLPEIVVPTSGLINPVEVQIISLSEDK